MESRPNNSLNSVSNKKRKMDVRRRVSLMVKIEEEPSNEEKQPCNENKEQGERAEFKESVVVQNDEEPQKEVELKTEDGGEKEPVVERPLSATAVLGLDLHRTVSNTDLNLALELEKKLHVSQSQRLDKVKDEDEDQDDNRDQNVFIELKSCLSLYDNDKQLL